MSNDTIRTPADLLRLTQEYDDTRNMILDAVLGEAALHMAEMENEIEGSLLAGLSEAETTAYFENSPQERAGETSSPARHVEWVTGSFDRKVFGHVTATDSTNALRGYRICDVNVGQICLDSAMRRPEGRVTGPRITIQAQIQPNGADITVTKSVLGDGKFEELQPTDADRQLIFKAANLLLSTLHARDQLGP